MDFTSLFLSMAAGLVGMGMLMYAKGSGRLVPVAAGLGLLTCPYFIPDTAALVAVCVALTALPFVTRQA